MTYRVVRKHDVVVNALFKKTKKQHNNTRKKKSTAFPREYSSHTFR